VTAISFDEARRLVSSLSGVPVREPRIGLGSFLTLVLDVDPRDHEGRGWYLWAYQCAWRLDAADRTMCGSEDDRSVITEAVARLDGQTVERFHVTEAQEGTLVLSDRLELRLFPVYSQKYIHWMLWLPDGDVLTAGPGRDFTKEAATSPAGAPRS
jgi:hypothetical protein